MFSSTEALREKRPRKALHGGAGAGGGSRQGWAGAEEAAGQAERGEPEVGRRRWWGHRPSLRLQPAAGPWLRST